MGSRSLTYEAKCDECGNEGYAVWSANLMGGSEIRWVGFYELEPDPEDVRSKRTWHGLRPQCECGSVFITIGNRPIRNRVDVKPARSRDWVSVDPEPMQWKNPFLLQQAGEPKDPH